MERGAGPVAHDKNVIFIAIVIDNDKSVIVIVIVSSNGKSRQET